MAHKKIIKALEHCLKKEVQCGGCPYEDNTKNCVGEVYNDAINLINSQKSVIDEQDEKLQAQADKIFGYEQVLKYKNKEIERLKDDYAFLETLYNNLVKELVGDDK